MVDKNTLNCNQLWLLCTVNTYT